jgi:hypothetical protein
MALAALSAVERIREREEDKRIKCNKRKQSFLAKLKLDYFNSWFYIRDLRT